MSDERDELEDLLKSPGFAWLQAYARKTYDDQLADYVEAAANESDPIAIDKLRQIAAARKAVRQLLEAPRQRISQLPHYVKAPSLTRGGV